MVSHSSLKVVLPSWLEVHFLRGDNLVWNKGKVQKDHDHVRLLASNGHFFLCETLFSGFSEPILDQLLSFWDESTYIVEQMRVSWVTENLVPRSSLNRLLWNLGFIESGNSVWVI
jgi:hypothetical protein